MTPASRGRRLAASALAAWLLLSPTGLVFATAGTVTTYGGNASLAAGRNLTATVTGLFKNDAALVTAGQDITLTAGDLQNLSQIGRAHV